MANKYLDTEQKVLDVLGAKDFRSITKDQLVAFASHMPDIPKEVAVKCIEQFPEFRSCANDVLGQLVSVCDNILKDNKHSRDQVFESYKIALEADRKYLEKHRFIRSKRRQEIVDQMIEIADKMAEVNRDNMKHHRNILGVIATVGTVALAIGGALLGVKINVKK